MKWYLISDETVQAIQSALENHPAQIEIALYQINTGLHITDAIPADYQDRICEHFEEPTHQQCSYCQAYQSCFFHNRG